MLLGLWWPWGCTAHISLQERTQQPPCSQPRTDLEEWVIPASRGAPPSPHLLSGAPHQLGQDPLWAALQAEPLPSASPFPGVRPALWVSPPSPSPPIPHRLPTQSGSCTSNSNQASELQQSSTWLLAQDPAGGWVPTSRNGIRDTHGHNMTRVLCVHLSPQSPTPSSS